MNKPDNFKLLKNIDIDDLNFFFKSYKNLINMNTNFNNLYGRKESFIDCNSYPLVDNFIINNTYLHEIFFDRFFELINLFFLNYGPGNFSKIQFSSMKPGGYILTHYDGGLIYLWSHRIHIPIITNDKVFFNVDGIEKNIKVGQVMEINNNKNHSVKNDGNEMRLHLILDYMPYEYYKIFSNMRFNY